jgi:hypothetical protein
MPIQHAIWKVGISPLALTIARLPSEQLLESMIVSSPDILSPEWMLIGKQESTGFGGRIDLLAIAPDGSLVLIEIKRDRTPREVAAQALDYASWVEALTADRIAQIYQRFSNGGSLSEAFKQRFGITLDEDALNESHQIILVAAALDDSTERIIKYLNSRDIAINVVFFQVFQNGDEQLLSRAWLIDPGTTQVNASTSPPSKGEKEPWNGEYYVSFGTGPGRTWEDARKYGFISAGGGAWYSRTLKVLKPGDRVWVKDPGYGYLGVGEVTGTAMPVKDFIVTTPAGEKPALDVLQTAERLKQNADDSEKAEYFVPVKWLQTVNSPSEAFDEVGLFGNQNTVCQPTTPKWRHTVDRLKSHFRNWNSHGTA